jgi:DNA helicase-2/ATP-dependent DNA helicase PcrA
MALGRYAREITEKSSQGHSKRLENILESGDITALESDDFAIGSIIEALDEIHSAPAHRFSREGLRRLIEFSQELALLRRALHGSITDLLIEAERFLRLDVEVLVRDGWESGRRHLDAFIDEASRFQRNGGTLGGFLRWLEVTDKREGGLKPASITVSNRAVQILTIHTAKGAEWDHVAIPGLVKGNFPSSGKKSDSWLKNSGSIPLDLRADALQFGFSFEFPPLDSPKAIDVSKALKAFDEEWKSLRLEEEYRLAYVAFTRARHTVLATSSIYRDGSKERDLSEIYLWIKEHLDLNDPAAILEDAVDDDGINPILANPRTAQWPAQSPRSQAIIESARLAASATAIDRTHLLSQELTSKLEESDRDLAASKAKDALSLIAEMQEWGGVQPVYLPDRLSVSALVALRSDPDSLALALRRPMPNVSNTFARRGTAFHQWVERYLQVATLFDDEIFDPVSPTDIPLEELKTKWLQSQWAHRIPVGVEFGFETLISGVVVKGRIDAIYSDTDGNFEVIDWKTGREKSGDDLAQAAIQLALYRLAYAKLHKIDIARVSAGFHYINENVTIKPADLLDESQLSELISSVELAPSQKS